MAEFLLAGVEVYIWLGDVYAYLVNYIHPWEKVRYRTQYYKRTMEVVFSLLKVPTTNLHFVEESSYESTPGFLLDQYRACTLATREDVAKVSAEAAQSAVLGPSLCPILQALAEEYLDADFQFGGLDQASHFAFAEKYVPLLGYRKRAHVAATMLPGLAGGKMSASITDSKLNFLDDPETLRQKLRNAPCNDGAVTLNPVLALFKDILVPIGEVQAGGLCAEAASQNGSEDSPFSIAGRWKNYGEIEQQYSEGKVSGDELKSAAAEALVTFLAPLRKIYEEDGEWQMVDAHAYPDPGSDE
ncbi:hypothetical protein SLS58_004631 [Diplodia intermedia]|uniref:tyrosine--tRNA ligase n=1 Tax=Diplodia intermedia TaxID=856260 RepID=A0ABR3TT78_9PEZI